ncbi:MAG: gamma carbonic anhydrase family protein [bacterium]|nr:gamma carbonic anhydrase family protein [bacterium]
MLISHNGNSPVIDDTAYIAPTATICGDVKIGPNCRVMHGASIIAEGGGISIGEHCIIFENAVVRSNTRHSTTIGDFCLIGPNAHVVGCVIQEEVFIATGAAIFHGAKLGKGSEVRINGVVHLKSYLRTGETVPIGWIAVGNPAKIFPPAKHDEISQIQMPLNFPLTVYGVQRSKGIMKKVTKGLSETLGSHKGDQVIE